MNQRTRIKHEKTFQERLDEQAKVLRDEAEKSPPSTARDLLLRRAAQADTASRVEKWLSSPGLRSPT
jgi:hypothetical protein